MERTKQRKATEKVAKDAGLHPTALERYVKGEKQITVYMTKDRTGLYCLIADSITVQVFKETGMYSTEEILKVEVEKPKTQKK